MVKTSLQPYSSDSFLQHFPLRDEGICYLLFLQMQQGDLPLLHPTTWKIHILISSFSCDTCCFSDSSFPGHNSARTQFPTTLPNARGLMPIHRFLSNNFCSFTVSQTCFQLKSSRHPDVQISHGEVLMGSEGRDNDERFPVLQVSGPFLHEKVGLQLNHWENLHPNHAITSLHFLLQRGQMLNN